MDEIINAYLTFKVGSNVFGIHVDTVVEIAEYQQPKSKSSALPYLLGLVEHRGSIIPLIDTGIKFGMDSVAVDQQTCMIVIEVKGASETFNVALLVDYVSEVVDVTDIAKQYIESNYKPGYVSFTSKIGDDFVLMLDVNKVFNDTDIVSMQGYLAEN